MAATSLPWLLGDAVAGPARSDFAGWLATGSELAAAACVAWGWVLTTLVVADALRGRAGPRPGVPPGVRRWVLAGCGVTLAGGLLAPAHAEPGAAPEPDRVDATTTLLVGLPLPDRTTTTTQWLGRLGSQASDARTGRPTPVGDVGDQALLVAPGDTLWGLAERTLPAEAGAAEVERRWQQIYRANREVVGADPDLIRPGQRLMLPSRSEDDL